jgi:UDP-N-acetylglucosamine 2-epimerase (non-hydrolysing)
MRVGLVCGTRPEYIRLSRIIPKLEKYCELTIIDTGQNYDLKLRDIFFEELGIRQPDHFLGAMGTFAQQAAKIFTGIEDAIIKERPEKLLVLGDTNSSLGAVIAKRMGVKVYHMEAGNRCRDNRSPEEVNRRIIDHSSDVLLPYTRRSFQNLIDEGIEAKRIYITGNPLYEVLEHYKENINRSSILKKLGVAKQNYFLVTMHRAENVDDPEVLASLSKAFYDLGAKYGIPVIISTHPHTRKLLRHDTECVGDVRWLEPFGLFDFVKLEKNALCVISDSGSACEEGSMLGVPNVHIRNYTERPETLDCGSNIVTGTNTDHVIKCVDMVLDMKCDWTPPEEYMRTNVSDTVVKILMSHRE